MRYQTRNSTGFTLIELLAVAAVAAMAGIGTILLLTRGNQKTQVLQTAHQLVMAARAARIHAVQHGQPCRLVMDREQGRFFVVGKAQQEDSLEEEAIVSNPFTRPVRLPEGVQFERIQILAQEPDLTEVVFEPNGSARTAIIQIGDGTNLATVTILEATGRVKMTPGKLTALLADQADLDEIEPAY